MALVLIKHFLKRSAGPRRRVTAVAVAVMRVRMWWCVVVVVAAIAVCSVVFASVCLLDTAGRCLRRGLWRDDAGWCGPSSFPQDSIELGNCRD